MNNRLLRLFLKGFAWVILCGVTAASILPGNHASKQSRSQGTLIVDGERRHYLLYVPVSYDPSKPTPLVISIHGYAGWPGNQRKVSGWDAFADRYGFIVVYPMGTGFPLHWRASGTAESYKDVDFINSLIDQLEADYDIDPQRIYANGHSNGGGMTFMLTCTLSDRIAAAGSVSGAYLYPWRQCQNQRPVPLIAFHGTADPIVPYSGGPSRSFDLPFEDVPTWIGQYAAHNGCQSKPQELPAAKEVTGVRYTGCNQGADVVFYTIAGAGHSWPGSASPLPEWIVGTTTRSIDATSQMWQFFSEHPLQK
jgi:polyhydroxybutyrate depolymerase